MSRTITDSTGTDIEVFTADELQQQREAALEEYKTGNPDKSDELAKLQDELKTKEEELTKLKGKDLNFSTLRTQKEALEKEKDDLKKEIDEKIGTAKREILEGVLKDHYLDSLKALAGDDPELQKKIEHEYGRIKDAAATKEEVARKLRDAWVLATKQDDPGALNSAVVSSGGVSRLHIKSDKKFSPEEVELGRKLGLESKDFEKYGK